MRGVKMRKFIGIAIFSVFFAFSTAFLAVAADYKLPDTGIQKCYDNTQEITCPNPGQAFYGQDAQYQGVQLAYKDNGDGTVTDLNTGLMWQEPDAGGERNWQKANDFCEALVLPSGGYSDWRLPACGELISLPDFGRYDPAINTEYFPGPIPSNFCYWSSTAYVEDSGYIWSVHFIDGQSHKWNKNFWDYTRCVRGGP